MADGYYNLSFTTYNFEQIAEQFVQSVRGSGAFCKPAKWKARATMEVSEARMLAWVAANQGEKPWRRKSKGSYPMLIRVGWVDP